MSKVSTKLLRGAGFGEIQCHLSLTVHLHALMTVHEGTSKDGMRGSRQSDFRRSLVTQLEAMRLAAGDPSVRRI